MNKEERHHLEMLSVRINKLTASYRHGGRLDVTDNMMMEVCNAQVDFDKWLATVKSEVDDPTKVLINIEDAIKKLHGEVDEFQSMMKQTSNSINSKVFDLKDRLALQLGSIHKRIKEGGE